MRCIKCAKWKELKSYITVKGSHMRTCAECRKLKGYHPGQENGVVGKPSGGRSKRSNYRKTNYSY